MPNDSFERQRQLASQWDSLPEGKQWRFFDEATANMRTCKDEVQRSVEQRQSMSLFQRVAHKSQHKRKLDEHDDAIQKYLEALNRILFFQEKRLDQKTAETKVMRAQHHEAYIQLSNWDQEFAQGTTEYRASAMARVALSEATIKEQKEELDDMRLHYEESSEGFTEEASRHELYAVSVAHTCSSSTALSGMAICSTGLETNSTSSDQGVWVARAGKK